MTTSHEMVEAVVLFGDLGGNYLSLSNDARRGRFVNWLEAHAA